MKNPCNFGLRCPYSYESEECEPICTYPLIRPSGSEEFTIAENCECPLMECDSELYDLLLTYQNFESVQIAVEKSKKMLDEEVKELFSKMKRNHE